MKSAVFFDRDGVLNHAILKNGKPYPPKNTQELIIAVDAKFALQQLKQAGYELIGVTNQPDVARGTTSQTTVEAINQQLLQELPLTAIYVCYHDDKDQCKCRKPLPGLLQTAADNHQVQLSTSFMIGDRWKDIAAGQAAGCKTMWLQADYSEQVPHHPDYTIRTLSEAADIISNIKEK